MTAQSLQSGVTVYEDFIKSEECHLPPLPFPFNFFGPHFNFRATTHDDTEMLAIRRTFMRIQLFRETFSEKVHATIPKDIIVVFF